MHRPEKIKSIGDDYDINEYLWMIPYPVKVPALEGVKFSSITQSGYWAHCALSTPETTDEEGHNLWCWGDDIRGLISGNNKQYAQEIFDNWANKIEWKGENPDYSRNYSPMESGHWHYRESSGDWFPMFGKPITNIKFYKRFERTVCNADNSYCMTSPGYCQDLTLQDGYTCQSSQTRIEMKNIKAVDITEYDSQLFFTTTETADNDRILHVIYTDNLLNEINTEIAAGAYDLNNEKIRGVKLGVEGVGRFIITENGNLYGFGSQRYGIRGNGTDEGLGYINKILMDENRRDLQVQELSVNKRSACASVKDQNAEDPDKLELYCWGSSTFGQLGFDNGDNDFSYGDVSTKWQSSGDNELMDEPSRMKTTPKKVLTDFTFDD